MKHLIIGAGATFAEALALGNAREICPPLIGDFARKTWANYSPHPLLELFLERQGFPDPGADPRELFYELEARGVTNIELFMEFAWNNRNDKFELGKKIPPGFISGLRITERSPSGVSSSNTRENEFWENLLYHGIGSPLQFAMIQCFSERGGGWKDLKLSKSVAVRFEPGDLVLNLNYDTAFELALEQLHFPFTYAPNNAKEDQILVCKPHGSLNLVVSDTKFKFGQPGWLGMPQTPGFRSYSGLISPRLNKNYNQHPIGRLILAPTLRRRPRQLIFWGVGLTESDQDLRSLFSDWGDDAKVVDIINPSAEIADKARKWFKCDVRHFGSVEQWLA